MLAQIIIDFNLDKMDNNHRQNLPLIFIFIAFYILCHFNCALNVCIFV